MTPDVLQESSLPFFFWYPMESRTSDIVRFSSKYMFSPDAASSRDGVVNAVLIACGKLLHLRW